MTTHAPLQRRDATPDSAARTPEGPESASGAPLAVQLHPDSAVGTTSLHALMSAGGNAGMVQLSGGGGGDGDDAVHQAAAHGVAGASGALPHATAIQRSFGSFDVGGVKAAVGGRAAEASAAMGADAYATGNTVAFKAQPDLHTAAHEAAHVVQQRAGVSLLGGVGKVGDRYEQHADAVADKVVRGESAESTLAEMAGGSAGGGVQRRAVQRAGERAAHDELLAIDDNIPEDAVRQNAGSFEELYAKAEAAQEELAEVTRAAAASVGAQAIIPPVKSRDRAQQKIDADFKGDHTRITDLARTTVMCDSFEQLIGSYRVMEKGTTITQTKNRFKHPKANLYRDMNLLVRLPKTGVVGEVQLHLEKIQEVKSGPEHAIYEEIQGIEREATKEDRPLSGGERARVEELQAQSRELYEKAWDYYYQRAMKEVG